MLAKARDSSGCHRPQQPSQESLDPHGAGRKHAPKRFKVDSIRGEENSPGPTQTEETGLGKGPQSARLLKAAWDHLTAGDVGNRRLARTGRTQLS